ncbi:MAG: extracellular solute-binding protein [Lachnospiraceae bacterium]|nr:extracellular solute-binding protein [Lachnospiraceae bacterium]
MKQRTRKMVSLALAGLMGMGVIAGCGSAEKISSNVADGSTDALGTSAQEENTDASSGGQTEITFATSWVGVSVATEWFQDRLEAFNKEYGDTIKVNVEEIAGDQAYVDKMKVLYSSDALPDVIATGGYNLIDTMKDKFVDLTPYIDEDWKNSIDENCWDVNSRDGKIYGAPISKQVIGYFYNKELFEQAGIDKPADTWDEFFQDCDKLKAAGVTPLSMDTADSGWVTSLMLGAMIGQTDEGEKFMNTRLPNDYNNDDFISAAANIQKMFNNYTSSDAIGGAYENAAGNFFTEQTAIIANGPWMISDFYDTDQVEEGFADKIGVAAFPGNVMYDAGKIGFNIASKTEEKTKAAITFVKFMTNEDSQRSNLEITGEIPCMKGVTSDKVRPLVQETIDLATNAKRHINDFQSLWYANVVDEISVDYPLLAQNQITPEEFAQKLTDAAQKN